MAKNFDLSVAAIVARDEAENFLVASVLVMEGITSPEVVETIACREGLTLASDMLLHKFMVTCDCINAVKNIHGEVMGLYWPIVKKIKTTRATFNHVELVHERRSSNVDAHRLARSSVYMTLGRHV